MSLTQEASVSPPPAPPSPGEVAPPRRRIWPFREMPGPRGHWLLGSAPELRRDLLEFHRDVHARYGDILRARLLNLNVVLVANPELLTDVLVRKAKQLKKSRDVGGVRLLIGKGLLSNDGEDHARQRRLIEPAFRHERMALYAKTIVGRTEARCRELAEQGSVDLHEELSLLTLEIVCEALFGLDVDEATDLIGDALAQFIHRAIEAWVTLPVPLAVPTAKNRAAKRALEKVNAFLFRLIDDRRAALARGEAVGDDLLSTLVRASDEEGGMSDEQLRDEVITLMLAGHETTAIALTFTLMLLADHPEVADRLDAELHEVLGGRSPGFDDLPRLTWARHVVEESMRLYPPAWIIGRQVDADDFELGGYQIPRGTQLFVVPWLLHRDGRYFEEPDAFKPERFETRDWPRGAYLPFGMGGRSCVGMHFAMTEAVLLLATFWQRLSVTRTGGAVELTPAITLRPKGGLPVRLAAR